jgi:hypothetical protein
MKNMYLSKVGKKWKAKVQGASRASIVANTKKEAVRKTAEYAKRQLEAISVKIRKPDGTFQEERTYPRSRDPSRSKG